MAKHSDRAKEGTRKQLDLQIKFIKDNIKSLEKERKKIESYRGKGLNEAFIEKSLKGIEKNLATRKSQLEDYEAKREEYLADDLI